ncbi:MAG TPA: glutathione S-transferase N-terminal domain-containing protein, partial [Solirubrobacteraceae bacterium]
MSASAPARLVTIPISHYCEKARWALDRAGIAYREERHVQIVHRVASRRAGGGGTVPVLVAPEGVFARSADIVAYADRHTEPGARLYPEQPEPRAEVVALERDFDADLGPEGRRWMYFHILPRRDLGHAYNCTG